MIELSFFEGFVVAVLGLGKSGLAAAEALQRSGAEVWAWDDNEDTRARARAAGINLVDLYRASWDEPVTLVISPGIPHEHPAPHPVAALAREHKVEIIGEIELLGRADPDARYVGVTGTNGKSTTTALIGHILQLSGRQVDVGGNLGTPATALERVGMDGIHVLEMSSYALEITFSITFDVAVLLNITPDHLERHGGMAGYVAAKRNIFRRQSRPRTAVIGVDDETCRAIHRELLEAGHQVVRPISAERAVAGGVYVLDGALYDDSEGQAVPALDLREVATLPGRHNWQNAAAAYAACRAIGLDGATAAACIRSFAGLPHRQELVETIEGIAYVNDSKATNADAAAKALACYDAIYWIVGGRAKETGLSGLEPWFGHVVEAFLIGESEPAFAAFLEGKLPYRRCGDLATALAAATEAARRDGRPGAVVLLSPACASFDQFASFEQRGDLFREAVAAIPGTRGEPAALAAPAAGGTA
ncbi:UDP-N-acetylmuramoylalanine--D-glutamate ligase [Tistlia consotensis]|uniref:UDP-N-acetylmuramoylalanine--D-glutamate ligase n=1 Tax=Tistlia consotensis USBA 355 TaxID=560819 RepID=A0A1Y6CJR8_9PROT|nr:UDP-N-acetylmuramoyl-L-alanine--D-glutamate ligase [Tistlia consotensis]SMF71012.1 UDP-N-acetylmuramoylalanine--D-glutamate ligase [Tistlia consotensis USBA 355]SNS07017.1 UDP-N-acetylmuramoylalanine--D-glutamate ligase [Tistlia consotensis]